MDGKGEMKYRPEYGGLYEDRVGRSRKFRCLSFEIPYKMWLRLDTKAKRLNISRSALARRMIVAQLKTMED